MGTSFKPRKPPTLPVSARSASVAVHHRNSVIGAWCASSGHRAGGLKFSATIAETAPVAGFCYLCNFLRPSP
jgi:hypothetical protein